MEKHSLPFLKLSKYNLASFIPRHHKTHIHTHYYQIMPATTKTQTIKGRPIGGKVWKAQRTRASRIVKEVRLNWELRKEVENKERVGREHEEELRKQVNDEKRAKRLRREENAARRKINELKSQTVQVIQNPRKLKRLSKKQMRNIRPALDTSFLAK